MFITSVAVTTYNGEKYIIEQLVSILNQTLKVNEVIICDDCSSDDTVNLIKEFIYKNGLEDTWKLNVNSNNKGFVKNFLDCASMTTGNIIFFSDQDDVWHKDKVKIITDIFKSKKDALAVGTSMNIINKNGNTYDSLYSRILRGNGKLYKNTFSKQVKNNLSTGATLAISRKILSFIIPIVYKYDLTHDTIIGLVASALDGYYFLGKPLLYRRLHESNVSNPLFSLNSRLKNVQHHIAGRRFRIKLMKCCAKELGEYITNYDRACLKSAIINLERSLYNLEHRNLMPLIKDLFIVKPMINKKICMVNILCAIYGEYKTKDILK